MSVSKNTGANNSTDPSKNDGHSQEKSTSQNRPENSALYPKKGTGVDNAALPYQTPSNPTPESIISLLNLYVPHGGNNWNTKASILVALKNIGATKEQAKDWYNSPKFKDRWNSAKKDKHDYSYGFLYNLIKNSGGERSYNDARTNDAEYVAPTPQKNIKINNDVDDKQVFKDFLNLVNTFDSSDFYRDLATANYAQYKEVKGKEYGIFVAARNIKLSKTQSIYKGCLIISIFDHNLNVIGFEFVANRKNDKGKYGKFTVAGSTKTGGSYTFRGNSRHILCEGWTTARKVHKATGATTYCCFGAGNIEAIAKQSISDGIDAKKIFLAHDADKKDQAWELRKELSCKVFVPEIGDWDDYSLKECKEEFENVIYYKPKHTGKNRRFFNQQYIGGVLGDIIENNAIAILKAAMATGKTYAVKEYIRKFFKRYGRLPKLIYIAPLTRLNFQMVKDINKLAEELTGSKNDYMSFYKDIKLETNGDAKTEMLKCFATTLQSSVVISKYISEQFDLMIVDEPESSSGMLASEAVKNITEVTTTLRKLGEHCKSIVLLDADANHKTKHLAHLFKPTVKASFYQNTFKSQEGFKFKAIYNDKFAETILIAAVIHKLKTKEKHEVIPFFCVSKVGQEKIKRIIENEMPETRILLINADTKDEAKELLSNKSYVKNFDLMIYNTALATGVSFDKKLLFTEMYALVLNIREFIIINLYLQATFRIRKPKNNTIIGNIPANRYSNDFGGTTKEVWEQYESERKESLSFMEKNTVYQHSDINEWITTNKKLDDIERELDKKFYKIKMLRELKKRGFLVSKFNDKFEGVDAETIINEMKMEKEERKLELTKHYLSPDFINKEKAGKLQMNKRLGIKLTVTEEAHLNKYYAIQSASLSFDEYNKLPSEEKLEIVTLRSSIKATCENRESATYTAKQNKEAANILTKYGENNPYSNASRLTKNKLMFKKIEIFKKKCAKEGAISSAVLSSKVNKKYLIRNAAYLNKLGVRFTEKMITNTENNDGDARAVGIWKKVFKLFGCKLERVRKGRSKDDQHDNKKADALYDIVMLDHTEKALERRKEKQDTLLDMTHAINKKLKQKATLDEEALKEIETESKDMGAYSIVKSLDRKHNVSERLKKMDINNRAQYKSIMDLAGEQFREQTENYFLRAYSCFPNSHSKALEKTKEYAVSNDKKNLEKQIGNIELKDNQYSKIKECLDVIPTDQHDFMIVCIQSISTNNDIDYALNVLEDEAEKYKK